MNLILWRHAEAEDVPDRRTNPAAGDFDRRLTSHGVKQAERVAQWLRKRLGAPPPTVLVSPAVRTIQTAAALTDRYRTVRELAPDIATAAGVLAAAGWHGTADTAVVIVGHQPVLGRVASLLLTGAAADWNVRKAAAWWFDDRGTRGRDVILRAVICADLA